MTTSFKAVKEVAITRMLRLFDTAFSGKKMEVEVSLGDVSSTAATDKKKVWIRIREGMPESTMSKAFNLHELSHALYSPEYSEITDMSSSTDQRNIANLLEDQRIEWIFSHKYPAARKYFVFLIEQMKIRDPLLLWGRRFMLPFKVEKPMPDTPRVAEIIDEYIVSRDNVQRKRLVMELLNLVGKKSSRYPRDIQNVHGVGASDEKSSESFGKEKAREQRMEKVEKVKPTQEEIEAEVEKKVEELAKEPIYERIPKEELTKKLAEEMAEKQAEEIAGEEERSQVAIDAEKSTLGQDISSAENEAETAVSKAVADMLAGGFGAGPGAEEGVSRTGLLSDAAAKPLTTTMPDISPGFIQNLSEILSRARLELAGEYLTEQRTGRINFRGLINPRPKLDVFKKFIPSREDEALLSLILYVDVSDSMRNSDPTNLAQISAFALSAAAHQCGSEVLVIAFSSRPELMAMPGETGIRRIAAHGGTEIFSGIQAGVIFSKDMMYQKVNIIITDGDLYDKDALSALVSTSILNYFILIRPRGETEYQLRPYGKTYILKGIDELPILLASIIDQLMIDKVQGVEVIGI